MKPAGRWTRWLSPDFSPPVIGKPSPPSGAAIG